MASGITKGDGSNEEKKILIILSEDTNEENRSRFAGDKKYQSHGCPESFDELIFPKDENKEHGHRGRTQYQKG